MLLYAPAKINLRLKVLGKKSDGYHALHTIFERIALFDKVSIQKTKEKSIQILITNESIPTGRKSLMYRTVDALKKECKLEGGVKVKIEKNIPVAAGLGGGSSDAASVLLGLSKLWKLPLKRESLMKIGKRLGADIPFFLNNTSFAIGEKRGDEIMPLRWKAKLWHLIVSPPVKLLSGDIYKEYDKRCVSGLTKAPSINKILFPTRRVRRLDHFKDLIENDLEKAAISKKPVIGKLKNVLIEQGFKNTAVSGSGPSVFCLFEKRKEALKAKENLVKHFPLVTKRGWKIFIVSTL